MTRSTKWPAGLRVGMYAAFFCLLGVYDATASDYGEDAAHSDLTKLSLEELMTLEVSSASRFAQKTIEAPAAVTVITATDIRTYGYRTLADALRSVRGMYTGYDRNYEYLGIRGFGRAGDFNSRILLLIDGYRVNDSIYDTAPIGTEFPLDPDLIDRIEIVRGPASSVYGSNAVFGIINVISRKGRDVKGLQAAGSIASYDTDQERLTWGGRLDSGFEWLLSGTRHDSDGQDLYFPEFDAPQTNDGIAVGLDGDRHENAYFNVGWHGFMLSGIYSDRRKDIPTGSYGVEFNTPGTWTTDTYKTLNLAYGRDLNANWRASGNVFYRDYAYEGLYPYGPPPLVLNRDFSRSRSWGGEVNVVGRIANHKLVFGAEYQDDFHLAQRNFDVDPPTLYGDDERDSRRQGVYVQDEITLPAGLLLNAGLRYDHYTTVGDTLNPRLALLWSPWETTTFKLLYGTAFRAPNVYELFYDAADVQKGNPDLDPEEITTWEFIIEYYLSPSFRLTLDAYHNDIHDLIDQVTDTTDSLLVFRNTGDAEARGIELEAERTWAGGTRLRASYAWQDAEDSETGASLLNSPRHLVKVNLALPVWKERVYLGSELQYVSRRKTLAGAFAGDYVVVNSTLVADRIFHGLSLSAGVYNLFDEDYAHVGGREHIQDVIAQDGRTFRVKLMYDF